MTEGKLEFDRSMEMPAVQNWLNREILRAAPVTLFSIPKHAEETISRLLSKYVPERHFIVRRHLNQELRALWNEAEAYGRIEACRRPAAPPKPSPWWKRILRRTQR